ncbi:MAG: alpha/beta fold hydrolase [Gemmatimonadetes bacterium]|nr:alpha/beta fold hydrolase [Gemmatimonadota bacterium]
MTPTPPLGLPAGELVEVGGRGLFLRSAGSGAPTVVLLGGAGGFSPTWALVQPHVAAFTRVCSYDRAGYGRSDPLPAGAQPTADDAERDLRALLRAAGLPAPYVLVAHALGGFHARLFAARHRDDVAGLVLVDVDHEDEWTDRFPPEHRRGLRTVGRMVGLVAALARVGVPQALARLSGPANLRRLPPDARTEALTALRPRTLRVIAAELRGAEASAGRVREEARPFGERPVVVVLRGRPERRPPGVSRVVGARIEALRADALAGLAASSTAGRIVTASSAGRDIPVEAPEVVVEAIRTVVDAARRGGLPG